MALLEIPSFFENGEIAHPHYLQVTGLDENGNPFDSVTFNVSIFTGLLAAVGMILHEFPEGIVTFLLLEHAGFDRRKSTIYPFISNIGQSTLGALLALSAGALVYVGASHLLPAVEKENKRYTLVSLAIGVLVSAMIVISKA
jgi:ZIP family zinc transporter/zinc and cadmium transporter